MADSEDKGDKVPECPRCAREFPVFDDWKCHENLGGCGFEISDKAKKSHGRIVTGAEAVRIIKEILEE